MTGGTVVVYSAAGRSRFLPVAAVAGVEAALPAFPIPEASGVYEGIDLGGPPAVRIDLVQALGGTARAGRYAMMVRTARGLVSLRVESAALAADAGNSAPGWDEIAALVAPLVAPAGADDPVLPAEPPLADAAVGVIVVQSGDRRAALPARAVERVERHRGAWRPLSTGQGERAVAIDGDILPGHSLAVWLTGGEAGCDAPGAVESAGWAVILRDDGGRPFALTVDAVHGLVSVPVSRVRCVPHRDGVSVWVPDGVTGLVQIIRPTRAGLVPAAPDSIGIPPFATPAGGAVPVKDHGAGIALTVGPIVCVIPAARVRGVRGGVDRLPAHRRRGDIPVFDPAVLLGLPPLDGGGGKTVVIDRPGCAPYALLASGVERRDAATGWLPLPAVPPVVHAFFHAIRPAGLSSAGPTLECLVRDEALTRPPRGADLAARVAGSLAGWLGDA